MHHCVHALAVQATAVATRRSCRNVCLPTWLLSTASTASTFQTFQTFQNVQNVQPRRSTRSYATQHQRTSSKSSASTHRRAVTPFNDDGHVPWSELSLGEKTGRAAQQSVNFGLVIVGVVLTGGVVYFLYTEVFSPESRISYFNRAVSRIRTDYQCTRVLGEGKSIAAFGQESWNKWQRARPIATTVQTDERGIEHIVMNFNVKGTRAQGVAYLHMVRPPGRDEFVYRYFYVDVPGHDRIYLERSSQGADHTGDKKTTLFGIKWS